LRSRNQPTKSRTAALQLLAAGHAQLADHDEIQRGDHEAQVHGQHVRDADNGRYTRIAEPAAGREQPDASQHAFPVARRGGGTPTAFARPPRAPLILV
jgi:hypothetical protein